MSVKLKTFTLLHFDGTTDHPTVKGWIGPSLCNFMLFFCILNSLQPWSGVLVSEKVVAQSRSLSSWALCTDDFREFWGTILLEIYGHFMGLAFYGSFFEMFFYAFLWSFYGWFFYDFQSCFSSASFRIEVPLILFPFSTSNNGFLNTMHCKYQISVIWKLEKV